MFRGWLPLLAHTRRKGTAVPYIRLAFIRRRLKPDQKRNGCGSLAVAGPSYHATPTLGLGTVWWPDEEIR